MRTKNPPQKPQVVLDVGEGFPNRAALVASDLLIGREPSTALAGAGQPPAQAGEESVYLLALGLVGEKAPGIRIADVADELAGQEQRDRLARTSLLEPARPSGRRLILCLAADPVAVEVHDREAEIEIAPVTIQNPCQTEG